MKVRGDEHVSPEIVATVVKLTLSRGWELTSVIDCGFAGAKDEHWVTAFGVEGGDAIVSADCDFITLYPQIKAVFDTGMRVILLPARWSRADRRSQAAFILQWWPRIEQTISTMRPRECYRPKWNLNETSALVKVKLDFHEAERRHKRQKQREAKANERTKSAEARSR